MKLKRIIERYIRGWFPQEPKISRQWTKYGLGFAFFAFLSCSFAVYFLLNSSIIAYVGASSIVWSKTYGGKNNEFPESFIPTSDGGYAIAGYTLGMDVEANEWWLIRTDESGNLLWIKTYSGLEWQLLGAPCALIEISGGGYAFAGTVDSPTCYDGWLAKTDLWGNIIWSQTYDSGGADEISTMIQTPDGGYLLAGTTSSLYYLTEPSDTPPGLPDEAIETWQESRSKPKPSGMSDAWLVKTDANGNMQWNKIYPGGNNSDDWNVKSLVATSDGGYALAGDMRRYGEDQNAPDLWLAKTDEFGNIEWSQTYGGTESDEASCLLKTSDGGYILAGSTCSFGVSSEDGDFYLVKTDANGNMQWEKAYGETNEGESNSSIETREFASSLVETFDGGYLLIGSTSTYDLSFENEIDRHTPISWGCWLVKTDSFGRMELNQTFAEKEIISLVKMQEGGYAFVGSVPETSVDSDLTWPANLDINIWLGEIGEFNG